MLRKAVSPGVTHRPGFWFEASVGAYYLAHLLTHMPPLVRGGSPVEWLDYQNRDGRLFGNTVLHLGGNE